MQRSVFKEVREERKGRKGGGERENLKTQKGGQAEVCPLGRGSWRKHERSRHVGEMCPPLLRA